MATKSFIATAFRPAADERRPLRTVYLRFRQDGGLTYSPNRWMAAPLTKRDAEALIASRALKALGLAAGGVQRA